MTGPERYRQAELLLQSCQLPNVDESYELYPALEDDGEGNEVHSTVNALAAAQVHATLALTAATVESVAGGFGLADWGEAVTS